MLLGHSSIFKLYHMATPITAFLATDCVIDRYSSKLSGPRQSFWQRFKLNHLPLLNPTVLLIQDFAIQMEKLVYLKIVFDFVFFKFEKSSILY